MNTKLNLRVIKTDNINPYENLAAEEFLTTHVKENEMILFLWQNEHTVVIGKNQNPWRECDVERIKADNIYLARRMSGGGAVYHDLGNLNFTFIARDGLYDISKQTDVILLACRLLGIKATKTGRNDLVIDGKKFSGHAYYSSNGCNYHHGTIMLDVNGEDLPKYLHVSDAKLKSKGVESVRSRVVNLRNYLPKYADQNQKKLSSANIENSTFANIEVPASAKLEIPASINLDNATSAKLDVSAGLDNPGVTLRKNLTPAKRKKLVAEMQEAMIKAAERTYDVEAELCELPDIPKSIIEKYTSESWRLGTKIPFEKKIEHRFEWGEVEIQLAMKGEIISDCRIYSDALEIDLFQKLEDLLVGCRFDSKEIAELKRPDDCTAHACEVLTLISSSI